MMVGRHKILKMLHRLRASTAMESFKHENENECITHEKGLQDFSHYIKIEPSYETYQCRVCLRVECGCIHIHKNSNDEDLSDALGTITGIEVSMDDPYPKHLCQSCNTVLQDAILFRKTAQNSDKTLRAAKIEQTHTITMDPTTFSTVDMNDYDDKESDHSKETLNNIVGKKKLKVRTWMCKRCDLQFQSYQEYTEHRLSDEHENKKVQCNICKKLYAPHYLYKHKRIHTGEVPHMCEVCGKKFMLKEQLNRHRAIHGYHLPHKCSICPYRGRYPEALKMHMRSHTGEKPYQCAQCPSRFISKSNLNKHTLTHKNEQDSSAEHNGKYEYKCESGGCRKSFHTRRDLERHVKVDHTGIRAHPCRFCDKVFGYRKQMLKHELGVHKRAKQKSGRMPIYLMVENMKKQGEDTTAVGDN